jgi:hypothetical protein
MIKVLVVKHNLFIAEVAFGTVIADDKITGFFKNCCSVQNENDAGSKNVEIEAPTRCDPAETGKWVWDCKVECCSKKCMDMPTNQPTNPPMHLLLPV